MTTLDHARRLASPRYSRPRTPWPSLAIHLAVGLLFVALVARAWWPNGLSAWSAGIVYVLYDTALLVFTFVQTLPMLRAPARQPAGARPSLAVLVAAHDEAAVLRPTLDALLIQSDPPDRIIVVDDGSTDATDALLGRVYGLPVPAPGESTTRDTLTWLRLPHRGKAAALNAALPRIATDIVMTVDADTLLEPGAVAAMRRAFAADPALVAATGIMTPTCVDTRLGGVMQWFQRHEYLRNFLSRYAWMRQDGLLLISGAFAGFRRAPVLAVGGFETDCLVEDYELIHRLRRHAALHRLGWHVTVLGDARAQTDAPATIGAFLRQRRRWFGGFLQTQYWYRDMVGSGRYGHVGTRMLPVKAADTFQPIYGLFGFGLLVVYLGSGHWRVLLPAAGVIVAKTLFDLAFLVWSVRLYRRWTGQSCGITFGSAVLAAILEPFSFQLLRHAGAVWGWAAVLSGRMQWGAATRPAEGLTRPAV